MSECKYRASNGECLYQKQFPYIEYCVDGPCPNYTAMANADKIRAMDIDHLIEWYCRGRPCGTCPYNGVECGLRDWLKQEAQDD